jgi:flagellar motor protein MotB
MRSIRLLPISAVLTVLILAGCRRQPVEDPRIRELEAENAALRAQLLAAQEKEPVKPEPAPRPAMDPATRRRLESSGVSVKESGDAVTLTLPNKVLFRSGSAQLQKSAKRALDQSAALIKNELRDASVSVVGHTDNKPIRRTKHLWKNNQELSVARARSVAAHLRKSGVASSRINIRGMGAAKPVASNKTAKGRALNRRVEIVINMTP